MSIDRRGTNIFNDTLDTMVFTFSRIDGEIPVQQTETTKTKRSGWKNDEDDFKNQALPLKLKNDAFADL